jgi:pimeloyl-ACP methyl ester carboxylesterase
MLPFALSQQTIAGCGNLTVRDRTLALEAAMRRSAVVTCALVVLLVPAILAVAVEPKDGTFTASDGVKIHYLTLGDSGAPVVLIHGYTGTAHGNWFANGIAEKLAEKHRVVAIDCRGHGKTEKPHDPAKYGPQMAEDVIELMDHLKIEKAHVHGYSMGGFIVTQLLAKHPDRFITASYGGAGVPEVDEKYRSQVPEDKQGVDPQEAEATKTLGGNPDRDNQALAAVRNYPWNPAERGKIELKTITIPVLAINGEFDQPNAKTHRMKRELRDFRAVVLPGKSHLTAIMAGYMPAEYVDSLIEFINLHDPK